jgi:hypothetical protein
MAGEKKDRDEREVNELLDRLLEGKTPEEIVGGGGLLDELTKRVMERALEGELTDHLGYEKHADEGRDGGNSRNGRTRKRVKTDTSELEIEVPRDRDATLDPKLVRKRQRRLAGFDEKVIALYARGMTTREIQGHLKELYKVEISPSLVSVVTDAVLEDVKAWQGRPLEAVYPIVYLDAIHVKVRSQGHVPDARGVPCAGLDARGQQGASGAVGGRGGGREVLALGVDGAQEPRGERRPDRGDRRFEGVSGGDRVGVPEDADPALDRPPRARLAQVRGLEGAQGRRA